MAEQQKDPYDLITEALFKAGIYGTNYKSLYPKLFDLFQAPASEEERRAIMKKLLKDKDFQKELLDWTPFENFDFDSYGKEDEPIIGLANKDFEDVAKWYARAKKRLDPYSRLRNTELYDTVGDFTFQQLEDKIGENYTGDWFGELLNEFNYPETPEGYEQLTQDLQTALTRVKNHDFSDKYGKAKIPLKFLNRRTFDVLEDGKKPSFGDVAVDGISNVAWSIPAVGWGKIGLGMKELAGLKAAGKVAPLAKVIGANVGKAAAAPATIEALDEVLGTDTEREKRDGMLGRARDVAINTAINFGTPELIKRTVPTVSSVLGKLGLDTKNFGYIQDKLNRFIDYGNRQNKADDVLKKITDGKDEALFVVENFAKNLGNRIGPVDANRLGYAAARVPERFADEAEALANSVASNGYNWLKGSLSYLKSKDNPIKERINRSIADMPKSVFDEILPYLSSYGVNRLGTNGVFDVIKRRIGRTTQPFDEQEQK